MGERFEAVSGFDDRKVAEVQPEAPHTPEVFLIVGNQQLLRPAAGAAIDPGGNGEHGRVIGELVSIRLSSRRGQGAHAGRWYLKIGHVARKQRTTLTEPRAAAMHAPTIQTRNGRALRSRLLTRERNVHRYASDK